MSRAAGDHRGGGRVAGRHRPLAASTRSVPSTCCPRAPPRGSRTAEEATRDVDGMLVNIAVGYGGRREIADAVRSLLHEHAARGTSFEELAEVIDVEHIAEHLYTKGQPDPDLVIRTSGEQRLGGFLLWQSATRSSTSARPVAGLPAGRLPARHPGLRRARAPLRRAEPGRCPCRPRRGPPVHPAFGRVAVQRPRGGVLSAARRVGKPAESGGSRGRSRTASRSPPVQRVTRTGWGAPRRSVRGRPSVSASQPVSTQHRTYVLDTSVLLADPGALRRFAEHEVVLPVVVITELEGKRHHPELGFFARTALRILDELRVQPRPARRAGPGRRRGRHACASSSTTPTRRRCPRGSGSATTTPGSSRSRATWPTRATGSPWSPRTCRCGSRPRPWAWTPRSTAPRRSATPTPATPGWPSSR